MAVVVLAYCLRMGLLGLLLGMVLGALLAVLYGFWNLRDSYKLYFDRGCLADMLVSSSSLFENLTVNCAIRSNVSAVP